MMCLKNDIKITAFLAAVNLCSDDVILETTEGDCLNLKSQLCRYVFAVASSNPSFFKEATITCKNEKDIVYLQDFLEK